MPQIAAGSTTLLPSAPACAMEGVGQTIGLQAVENGTSGHPGMPQVAAAVIMLPPFRS
jgi:hypothetical protein